MMTNTEENKSPETETTETTATTPAVEKAPRKRKAKVAAEPKNKTSQARAIYKSLARGKNGPNRQKVLERFQSEVGLTKAGASTYYQKLKTEFAAANKKSA